MQKDAPEGEKVREVTSSKKNNAIDDLILSNIQNYSLKDDQEISNRITALDKEWDIERVLDLTMSALALIGITSSILINQYSIILPIIMLLFFIWHAFQGWCPPLPLLRYFKVRTRPEIDREKYALKAIRGDFDGLSKSTRNPERIFEAVKEI